MLIGSWKDLHWQQILWSQDFQPLILLMPEQFTLPPDLPHSAVMKDPITLSQTQLEQVIHFHKTFFCSVLHRLELSLKETEKVTIVLPSLEGEIDWNSVENIFQAKEEPLLLNPSIEHLKERLDDCVVKYNGRRYYASFSETFLHSPFPSPEKGPTFLDYYQKKGINLQHKDLPLVQLRSVRKLELTRVLEDPLSPRSNCRSLEYVPPELLKQLPLPGKYWKLAPSLLRFLWDLERRLLAKEILDDLPVTIPVTLVETALTSASIPRTDNYERLEILGDAVLKWATSLSLYVNPKSNEGDLTRARKRIISNQNLCDVGKKKQLTSFLIRECKYDIAGMDENVVQQIPMKRVADPVEALIGAAYISEGMEGAFNLMVRFEILQEDLSYYLKKLRGFSFDTEHKMIGEEQEEIEKITGYAFSVSLGLFFLTKDSFTCR